jgi:hypothetical protein
VAEALYLRKIADRDKTINYVDICVTILNEHRDQLFEVGIDVNYNFVVHIVTPVFNVVEQIYLITGFNSVLIFKRNLHAILPGWHLPFSQRLRVETAMPSSWANSSWVNLNSFRIALICSDVNRVINI